MSTEEVTVELAAVEPPSHNPIQQQHTSSPDPTLQPLQETIEQPHYTDALPPLKKNHIRIIYNNTISLKTQSNAELQSSITEYLDYKPIILGIVETNQNWSQMEKKIKPLQQAANILNQDHEKITTVHYQEKHSAANVYQPGRVVQLIFKPLSNRINDLESDDLGRWSWLEICLNKTSSLFTYTGYRPCKALVNSKKTMTWDQQVWGLLWCGIDDLDPQKTVLHQLCERNKEMHMGRPPYCGWHGYQLTPWWWQHIGLPSRHWPDWPLWWLLPQPPADLHEEQQHNG